MTQNSTDTAPSTATDTTAANALADTTAETATTSETERVAPGNGKSSVSESGEVVKLTDFEQVIASDLTTRINGRNGKQATLVAIGGDPEALMISLEKSSTDPAVVKVRNDIELTMQTLEKLRANMRSLIKPIADKTRDESKSQIESLKSEIESEDKTIKAAIFYAKQTMPNVLKVLPELTRVNAGVSRGPSTGPDGRKIRGWQVSVNGELATLKGPKGQLSNLAAAAAKIDRPEINTKVLQTAFFNVVGESTDPANHPNTVDFTVNAADGTAFAIHMVKVQK